MARSVTYHKVFTLALSHGYYRDGIARTLRLEPTRDTLARMPRNGTRIQSLPNRVTIWRADDTARPPAPNLEVAPFAFALVSDDPWFLAVTQPEWSAPAGTGPSLLHASNRDIPANEPQLAPSLKLAALPATRKTVLLPDAIAPGAPLRLLRWWNREEVWEGEAPALGRALALPPLADGRYTLEAEAEPFDFCLLDHSPSGLVGLVELVVQLTPDFASVVARLPFKARTAIWDYVIIKRTIGPPLDKYRVATHGGIQFTPARVDENTWRFSSPDELPLAEVPELAMAVKLAIPQFELKPPDTAALPSPGPEGLRTGTGPGTTRSFVEITL